MKSTGDYRTTVSALSRDLRYLVNCEYERRVRRNFTSYASTAFRLRSGRGLRRTRMHSSNTFGVDPSYLDLISDAVDDGLISDSEWDELIEVDAVMSGLDGSATVYFVAEISLTVSYRDIDNAIARGTILSKATGAEAWPMLIGETIPEPQKARAEREGVSFREVEW